MPKLRKKDIRLIIAALSALVVLVLGYYRDGQLPGTPQAPPAPGTYRLVQIEDGDTITVNMNGRDERIRMIGVDTPETHDPRKPVQCFGRAATAFTTELIGNADVRLEADPLSSNRDRYDRLLRYIYLPDGRLVQAEIIREGYGFAYTSFPFTKSDEFRSYQKEAREAGKGLWNSCQPEENKFGGFTSNPEK